MKLAPAYLLLYLFLNALLLSTGGVDSKSELFHDLKITVVADGQSQSLDSSFAESSDHDSISLTQLFTPFITNHSEYIANQPRFVNLSVPINSIRAPPQ